MRIWKVNEAGWTAAGRTRQGQLLQARTAAVRLLGAQAGSKLRLPEGAFYTEACPMRAYIRLCAPPPAKIPRLGTDP